MDETEGKWYCLCGQANASHFQKCIHCNAAASEGASSPFTPEQVVASGKPMAEGKFCGNLIDKVMLKARIAVADNGLMVTESKRSAWIAFLGLLVVDVVLVALFFVYLKQFALIAGAVVTVPVLLVGATGAFVHKRLVLDGGSRECKAQHRWLCFSYKETVLPMDEYMLTRRAHRIRVDVDVGGTNKEVLAASLVASLGTVAVLAEESESRSIAIPALALTSGPQGEVHNLMLFGDENLADDVMHAVEKVFPENLLAAGNPV